MLRSSLADGEAALGTAAGADPRAAGACPRSDAALNTTAPAIAVPAPNNRYKAVVVWLSQGGDAPFCYASVSVYLAIYPNDFAESEKSYQVYWAPCATPAKSDDVPTVEWLAKDKLQVTYTPGPPAKDATKLRRRVVDASRYVQVTYVERK